MSLITISASLLASAKNYLDITWTDTDLDARITSSLQRGCEYITDKTGIVDIENSGRAMELLMNYIMYDREGKVNEFKQNYKADIVGLQVKADVENYEDTISEDTT